MDKKCTSENIMTNTIIIIKNNKLVFIINTCIYVCLSTCVQHMTVLNKNY